MPTTELTAEESYNLTYDSLMLEMQRKIVAATDDATMAASPQIAPREEAQDEAPFEAEYGSPHTQSVASSPRLDVRVELTHVTPPPLAVPFAPHEEFVLPHQP